MNSVGTYPLLPLSYGAVTRTDTINPITTADAAAEQLPLLSQTPSVPQHNFLDSIQPLSAWTLLCARGNNVFVKSCLGVGMIAGCIASVSLWSFTVPMIGLLILTGTSFFTVIPYLIIMSAQEKVDSQEAEVLIALQDILTGYLSGLGIEEFAEEVSLEFLTSQQATTAAIPAKAALDALKERVENQNQVFSPRNTELMMKLDIILSVAEDPSNVERLRTMYAGEALV